MTNQAKVFREANPDKPILQRGKNSIVFDEGLGKRKAIFTGRIHDTDGNEVDDAWISDIAPWDFKIKNADFLLQAKEQFNTGQIALYTHKSGETVGFQPQQIQWRDENEGIIPIRNVEPSIGIVHKDKDNTLVYDDAFGSDTEFRLISTHQGLAKELEITAKLAVPENAEWFSMPFIFQKSRGLDIYVDGRLWNERTNNEQITVREVIEFRLDNGDNAMRFMSSDAFQSGDDERPVDVQTRLRKRGQNLLVDIRINAEWMRNASYPVVIDPSFSDQPDETDGVDTFINNDAATTNYGTAVQMWCKNRIGDWYKPMMRWDISSIPSNATCDDANLVLSIDDRVGTTNGIIDIHRMLEAWVETEATWNIYATSNNWNTSGAEDGTNDYESGTILATATNTGDTGTTTQWDFTASEIDTDISNGSLDIGLYMRSTGNPNSHKYATSGSSTSGDRPVLTINYTESGNFQAVAGSITPSGETTKKTLKSFASSITATGDKTIKTIKSIVSTLTPSGILATSSVFYRAMVASVLTTGAVGKKTLKIFTSSITAAGGKVLKTAKSLAGSITTSGILATASRYSQALVGTISTTGTLIKKTGKSFVGTISTTGDLVRKIFKTLIGSTTPSGFLVKKAIVALTGSVSSSGVLSLASRFTQALSASVSIAGDITKKTVKSFVGTLSATGTLAKKTMVSMVGTLSAAGVIASTKLGGLIQKALSGSIVVSGVVAKKTSKGFSGLITTTGTVAKKSFYAMVGSITATGSTIKKTALNLYGIITSSAILTYVVTFRVALTGAITAVGNVGRKTFKTFTGSITTSGAVATARRMLVALAGMLSSSGSIATTLNPLLTAIKENLTLRAREFSLALKGRSFGKTLRERLFSLDLKDKDLE